MEALYSEIVGLPGPCVREKLHSPSPDVGLDAEINHTITAFADYTVQAGKDNYFGQSVQASVKIGF